MAVYKVIQDIEAEDKIIGPLTLKQFIFAFISAGIWFLGFMIARSTAWPVMFIFLFISIPTTFLAAPLGRDQPNDVWLAAQIRFFLKPRRRIWDQSGIKELVTITAPKREPHVYTDGLSQNEVKSRLTALATTIDSRGWAVKNIAVNLYNQPGYINTQEETSSDRLINPITLPAAVPDVDIAASDDVLDDTNSVSQHFTSMINEAAVKRREDAMQKMHDAATKQQSTAPPTQPVVDPWFLGEQAPKPAPGMATFQGLKVVAPHTETKPETFLDETPKVTEEEAKLSSQLKEIKAHDSEFTRRHHERVINPHHEEKKPPSIDKINDTQKPKITSAPAIINKELSRNNDQSVANLSKLAKEEEDKLSDGTTISFH